jgi:sec-independent protein translocase protein TatA
MLSGILQPTHLIIVLVVALVILGPKRLPDAGRALGQGLREFKSSVTGTPESTPEISAAPVTTDESAQPDAGTTEIARQRDSMALRPTAE